VYSFNNTVLGIVSTNSPQRKMLMQRVIDDEKIVIIGPKPMGFTVIGL